MKKKVRKLSIWFLVMLMVCGSLLTSVSGAVSYTYKEGNDQDNGINPDDYKVWSDTVMNNATHDGITVTYSETADGTVGTEKRYIAWTSDSSVQIKYVWVKASNGGHLYSYTDQSSDTGLHGPLTLQGWPHQISHVTFYYVDTAQLKVQKVLNYENGNAVSGDNHQFNIDIKKGNDIVGSCNISNGGEAVFKLPLGTYTVSEVLPQSPYSFVRYTQGVNDSDGTIVLDQKGQIKTLVVVNEKTVDPPLLTGSITITKKVVRSNDVTQVISDDLTEFDGRLVYAPENPVGTPPQYSFSVKQNTPDVINELPLGRYQVIEESKAGYTLLNNEPIYVEITAADTTGEVMLTNVKLPGPPAIGSVKVVKTIGPNGIPMKGVQFRLTINNEDIRYLTTAANGEAVFENVPAGTYTLLETVPVGFEAASATHSVTVEAGKTATVNVTNTPKVNQGQTYDPGMKIKGYKFNDINKNERRDEGEPGLPNWTIELYRANLEVSLIPVLALNDDDPIATTETDANGYYEFTGLGTGYYIVKEVQKTGWACSTGLEHMVHLTGGSYTGEIAALNLLDDANFKKAMPNANTVFEAEGRIGLPGESDYELALKTIHPTTVIQTQEYADDWKNFAEPQPFTLSLRHTGTAGNYKITITFEALGRTLQTTLDNQYPNDIVIRTRSAESGSGIIINKLMLNGTAIEDTSVAVNGIRDTDILLLPNLYFGVYSNFDLTGEVMMYWDEDAIPERSELAFQIAVGDTIQSQTKFVDFGNYESGDSEEPNPPIITKTDERTSARPGDLLAYKITVDPNDYDLHEAYLLESPDLYTEYAGGDEWGLVETKADGRKVYRYNLYANMPTLSQVVAPSVPQVPDFKVRVKESIPRSIGVVTNTVKLYYDEEKDPVTATDTTLIIHPTVNEPDPPVINTGKPDLKITKTDKGAMVSVGAIVEYFIGVENKGTTYAQGVKVYETLPEGTTFVEGSNPGWALENGKYVYNLGQLNVGEMKEVKFVIKVNDPFPMGKDKILNDVEVKDNGTETATADNKASDDTPVLIPTSVAVEPPVIPPTTEPEPPEEVVTEPEPQIPDLPFTGGVAEVELLFAGMGVLLMAGGMALKKRR